eukprot:3836912-Rhodomonas_salina.1
MSRKDRRPRETRRGGGRDSKEDDEHGVDDGHDTGGERVDDRAQISEPAHHPDPRHHSNIAACFISGSNGKRKTE